MKVKSTKKQNDVRIAAQRTTALLRDHADMSTQEIRFRIESRQRELADGEAHEASVKKIIEDARIELANVQRKNVEQREDIAALSTIVDGRRF